VKIAGLADRITTVNTFVVALIRRQLCHRYLLTALLTALILALIPAGPLWQKMTGAANSTSV
jgi:hypothetical protein